MKSNAKPTFDEELIARNSGYFSIAGIDEVGRGPIAGPVVSAAVILETSMFFNWLSKIRDSKQLSHKRRVEIFDSIVSENIPYGIGIVSSSEIDDIGIVEATRKSMIKAVDNLGINPDFLLIDAVSLDKHGIESKSIINGDQLCLSIAAASIVAKVCRDSMMLEEDYNYPGYGFAQNKGYPTKLHMDRLRELGPTPIHRFSFAPVRDISRSW